MEFSFCCLGHATGVRLGGAGGGGGGIDLHFMLYLVFLSKMLKKVNN